MDSHRERELKFDVDDQFAVPDLDELASRSARIERRTLRMASTYYDTEERALLAAGLTLRHRDGEADTGWQLKVPTRSARTEITVPLQAGPDVPDRFRGLLVGVVRGRPLRPVAVIRTERVRHRLLEDERVLLEIADDHVQGTALGDRATVTAWREVEAELGPAGDERLLQQAASVLRAAGATPSQAGSKLAKTLGIAPAPSPRDASAAVGDYARRQWQAIVAGDIALRRGFDKVHKTRVAVRRFRSMLRVLRPQRPHRPTDYGRTTVDQHPADAVFLARRETQQGPVDPASKPSLYATARTRAARLEPKEASAYPTAQHLAAQISRP